MMFLDDLGLIMADKEVTAKWNTWARMQEKMEHLQGTDGTLEEHILFRLKCLELLAFSGVEHLEHFFL